MNRAMLESHWRRMGLIGNLAVGATLVLAGCGDPGANDDNDQRKQASGGYMLNSGGYMLNSGGYMLNGGGQYFSTGGGIPNGGGSESGGNPNSGHQTGLGWNGWWAPNAYTEIGWNNASQSWSFYAWGGVTAAAVDCAASGGTVGQVSVGADNACTTLHNAINHTDVDGDGVAGTDSDKNIRLNALSHWVACACPSTVSIPFSDTHGFASMTLSGNIGLAPTWCGSSISSMVPDSEIQLVSACMLALQNTSWKHFPLSLRTVAGPTATSANETLLDRNFAARYWGNLWKDPHIDYDHTTCNPQNPSDPAYTAVAADPSCTNPEDQGGAWYNMERFSYGGFGPYGNPNLADQFIYGRECEVSNCGGGVEWLGLGVGIDNQKRLAGSSDASQYAHVVNGTTVYESIPSQLILTSISGGITPTMGNDAFGSWSIDSVGYRGETYKAVDAYAPLSIPVEDPLPNLSYLYGSSIRNAFTSGYGGWAQVEAGSIPQSQSTDCAGGKMECQGSPFSGNTTYGSFRKLLGLNSSQSISLNYSGYQQSYGGWQAAGDPNTPVMVALRYQRSGCLLDGQCDPVKGCAGTTTLDCASGAQNSDGSCHGSSGGLCAAFNPPPQNDATWRPQGQLEIDVMGIIANNTNFVNVHGNTASGKNLFPPTGIGGGYNTAYIYPVYVQNSYNTIPGTGIVKPPSNTSADTLRVRLTGSTANTIDAPQIDTAYFAPGMPGKDMNCTTGAGCWLYAGPNYPVSLSSGQSQLVDMGQTNGDWRSPILPPGNYTFQLNNVWGRLQVSVKANGNVYSSQDCVSASSCTVPLTQPGYFTVLVTALDNQTCTLQRIGKASIWTCNCPNHVSGCASTGTIVGHN